MKQIKKTLSIFMAAVFVMAGFLGNVTAKAAEAVVPVINFIGVEHSPLVVGDTETFTVTSSNYEGKVQYRAFLQNVKTGKWTELTSGYTVAQDGKSVVTLPKTSAFELGKYKLSVWVKRDGVAGKTFSKAYNDSYDNYLVSNLNCVAKDDANRVYATGAMNVKVEGLKVTIDKIEGLNGIEGPYQYRLHYMDVATGTWTKNATPYADKVEFTFPKAGTYVLDVYANTEKSTTWKTYLANKNAEKTIGTFEAWKLAVVTVTDSTVNVFDTTVKAATFGSTVNVTMTAEGTKQFASATQYQILNGTSPISSIVALGTPTTVFPAKALGDKVNVKLVNASGVEVKTIEVLLGQSGKITVVPPVKAEVKATVKTATFGATVTVTSTQVGAVKYQVLNGTAAISSIVDLGTSTTIFPAKVAGDKVNVNLLNAAGTVVSTTEVVLVAAQ